MKIIQRNTFSLMEPCFIIDHKCVINAKLEPPVLLGAFLSFSNHKQITLPVSGRHKLRYLYQKVFLKLTLLHVLHSFTETCIIQPVLQKHTPLPALDSFPIKTELRVQEISQKQTPLPVFNSFTETTSTPCI